MGTKTRSAPSGPYSMQKYSVTLSPGTLASHATTSLTFGLTGVRTTDCVTATLKSALPAGAGLAGLYVSAAGVVTAQFTNPTPANVTGGTLSVDVVIQRFSS